MTVVAQSHSSLLSEDELDALLNCAQTPLAKRFRCLFQLKAIASDRAIEIIGKG